MFIYLENTLKHLQEVSFIDDIFNVLCFKLNSFYHTCGQTTQPSDIRSIQHNLKEVLEGLVKAILAFKSPPNPKCVLLSVWLSDLHSEEWCTCWGWHKKRMFSFSFAEGEIFYEENWNLQCIYPEKGLSSCVQQVNFEMKNICKFIIPFSSVR